MANDKKTITCQLSPLAKKTLFYLVRNKEGGYAPDLLPNAGSLLQKLREGAEPRVVSVPTQTGNTDVTIYENFTATPFEMTADERVLGKQQFTAVKGWNPDTELELFSELQEFFKD